ncbi:hypothetical protein HOA92_05555 [archaeon]|nr:hypothetical protein [archaeon]MBT6762479.1 hypothetical protein [archaeon]
MPAYIFLCNKCLLWGSGATNKIQNYSYHCYRCNQKQRVMHKVTGTQVRHKGPYNTRAATLLVKEINAPQNFTSITKAPQVQSSSKYS